MFPMEGPRLIAVQSHVSQEIAIFLIAIHALTALAAIRFDCPWSQA
jgi:hypothetical protein